MDLNTFLSKYWNVLSFIFAVNDPGGRRFLVSGNFDHLDTKYSLWLLWALLQISFTLQNFWFPAICANLLLMWAHLLACSQCLSRMEIRNFFIIGRVKSSHLIPALQSSASELAQFHRGETHCLFLTLAFPRYWATRLLPSLAVVKWQHTSPGVAQCYSNVGPLNF